MSRPGKGNKAPILSCSRSQLPPLPGPGRLQVSLFPHQPLGLQHNFGRGSRRPGGGGRDCREMRGGAPEPTRGRAPASSRHPSRGSPPWAHPALCRLPRARRDSRGPGVTGRARSPPPARPLPAAAALSVRRLASHNKSLARG